MTRETPSTAPITRAEFETIKEECHPASPMGRLCSVAGASFDALTAIAETCKRIQGIASFDGVLDGIERIARDALPEGWER